MNAIVLYNPENYLPHRLFSLFYHGVKSTPAVKDHTPNLVEKIGNGLLLIPENTPKYVKKFCTNPQTITIAAFTTAHLLNSYLFYPDLTVQCLNAVYQYLPILTPATVRFTIWLTGTNYITGLCARAGGRLTESYILKLQNIKAD